MQLKFTIETLRARVSARMGRTQSGNYTAWNAGWR